MDEEKKKSGLQIDSDWKAEAAREKERLAEKEPPPGSSSAKVASRSASFVELINLLAMQAIVSLGGMQGPGGERMPANPAAAKFHIDLLDTLEQKTKGNLTEEEQRVLDGVLYELRLQYVHAVSGVMKPETKPG